MVGLKPTSLYNRSHRRYGVIRVMLPSTELHPVTSALLAEQFFAQKSCDKSTCKGHIDKCRDAYHSSLTSSGSHKSLKKSCILVIELLFADVAEMDIVLEVNLSISTTREILLCD